MTTTDEEPQRFARFFEAAMLSAGYAKTNREPNVPALSRDSGVSDPVLRRWLAGTTEPTIPNLRLVVPWIKVPLLELVVAAEILTAAEARLEGDPTPPRPPATLEDVIRGRKDLTAEQVDLMIRMLGQFTDEPAPRYRA